MELKRELGIFDLFSISSGAMISSGLFILPGIAFGRAGSWVIYSYLLASILTIPAMLSKMELSTAMPKAGGSYFFIDRGMGPAAGTVGGIAAWFSLAFKSAFALLGIGAFAVLFNPGLSEMQLKLIAVLFCVVFMFINLAGVGHSGKAQRILVVFLISALVMYILLGLSRTSGMPPPPETASLAPIITTAGFVFVSYGGLTKIASVAEEAKNPSRSIPIAMVLSWLVVSLLYIFVIYVTIGVTDPGELKHSLTPISLGAGGFAGSYGSLVMALAAIAAFVSTGNAGILAASRIPLAMSRDELLPKMFSRSSERGVPRVSIVFTSLFMIFVIFFLDLESFVETASVLMLILYLLVNLSHIFMRSGSIHNYQPKFKSPLYPWIQICGIVAYGVLIATMGLLPLMIAASLCGLSAIWYLVYTKRTMRREYALLHIIENSTGEKKTNHLLEEELRSIIVNRDTVFEDLFCNPRYFEKEIERSIILDIEGPIGFEELFNSVVNESPFRSDKGVLKDLLERGSTHPGEILPGISTPSIVVKGKTKFELVIVRCRRGVVFPEPYNRAYAILVLFYSSDMENYSLSFLACLAGQLDPISFEREWLEAENTEGLRKILSKDDTIDFSSDA